nr:HoxN/HupN/NixA family nickel/cobalt transporter [Angustibacter aerolatus]
MSAPSTAQHVPLLAPVRGWQRVDTRRLLGTLAFVALLHVVGWGVLLLFVVPQGLTAGAQVFGVGLGVTAYTLGMRHAFDADHIAAIDNTTRKAMTDGQRPVSVGFWFSLGHSSVVFAMALVVAAGARFAGTLVREGSPVHQALGVVGTSVSGLFLYLIGILNLVALVGIVRVFRRMRRGEAGDEALEEVLGQRGLLARVLRRVTRTITKPWQMYPAGVLFGLGFDTATEISLLVLAGAGAASGLPWYAVMVLPVLFAAGMSLLDTLDGAFMNVAYQWAFANPVRKVFYNLTITGLSVAVALLIGTVEPRLGAARAPRPHRPVHHLGRRARPRQPRVRRRRPVRRRLGRRDRRLPAGPRRAAPRRARPPLERLGDRRRRADPPPPAPRRRRVSASRVRRGPAPLQVVRALRGRRSERGAARRRAGRGDRPGDRLAERGVAGRQRDDVRLVTADRERQPGVRDDGTGLGGVGPGQRDAGLGEAAATREHGAGRADRCRVGRDDRAGDPLGRREVRRLRPSTLSASAALAVLPRKSLDECPSSRSDDRFFTVFLLLTARGALPLPADNDSAVPLVFVMLVVAVVRFA